jgi:uncharacterized repeat protein (TIGR01451 family)
MKSKLTRFALFVLLLVLPARVGAFRPPAQPGLPDFDRRQAKAAKEFRAAGEQRQAAALLAQAVPGLRVSFDEVVGSPRWVWAPEGFLSGPGGKGGAIGAAALAAFPANDPHRAVKAFLEQHAALFGHGAQVLSAAKLKREYTTAHSGLRSVVWEQQFKGIPVFEGLLIAHLAKGGELVSLSSRFVPALEQAALAGAAGPGQPVELPLLSAREAVAIAATNLEAKLSSRELVALSGYAPGADQPQRFKAAALRGEARASLVWLPLSRAKVSLCWQVELGLRIRPEWYRVVVEAQSGQVLLRRCLTKYASPATYRVFTSDSPSPFSPGHAGPSSGQPPVVERELVSLEAWSTNASPNGWIAAGDNQTKGNNVDAHLDRNDDDLPDLPRPQGSPERVFDFPLSLTNAPTTYSKAAVVQLFYWNNWMHDRLYELGFTEAAGNFQATNFDRGGLGSDAVEADAQDGGGFNNANFSTFSDGVPPRMQMYIFTGPAPDRDGDLDAEIILHEYTHGLSERRVGGGVGLYELQAAGLGEGWSDFYALALLSEPTDDLNGNYAAGAYVSFRLEGLTENYYFGIRRYPYSTDLTKNPLTFKDIDPTQASSHPGVPLSPIFSGVGPAEEVHNQGEVWCVTLWEARANLIGKHGFAAGNQLVLELVTDGMNLAPPNPTFVEARDAIVQADLVKTGGANRLELWAAFAKRGLGFGARAPRVSTTIGVVEGFDVPDDLLVADAEAFVANGPEGGRFAPASRSYTLSNVGTNTVTWSLAGTASWLDLSPRTGTLLVGAEPVEVTVALNAVAANLPVGVYRDSIIFTNHVTGRVQSRGAVLRVGQPDHFTRMWDEQHPPLSHTTLTFTPDGSPSFYRVCAEPALEFPTDFEEATALWLGDDDYARIEMPEGKTVSLYGTNYPAIYVSANGYITFRVGVSDWAESLVAHFGLPRVSVLFHDFNPETGGVICWQAFSDRVAVTYLYLPEYREANENSFQAELFFDGRIRLTWLDIEASSGLTGLSGGGRVPADFASSDLGAAAACAPLLQVTLPASATEGTTDLSGRVSIPEPLGMDLTVQLGSLDSNLLSVAPAVVIPAGQACVPFAFALPDNGQLDGTRIARVVATAEGYTPGSERMFVHDNESATLTVTVPKVAEEGDPVAQGTITVSQAPAAAIVVSLAASDTNEVQTPRVAIIPAGQSSTTFELRILDDHRIDGTREATVTASVANWTPGTGTISVLDNEDRNLKLALRPCVGENSGVVKAAGSVSLSGTLPADLVVSLTSSDTSELTVPPTVTIPAGQTAVDFDLTAVDDEEVDGPQTVTVAAAAPDFTGTAAVVLVGDDETPPVPARPTPPHLSTNNPPNLTLSWTTGEGEAIVNGGFETGDFSGWVAEDSGGGRFVIDDGTLDPEGPDGPLPPFAGGYNAISQQIGPGKHVLYQEVTLPLGVASAALKWADRIRNHASLFVEGEQEFRVEIQSQEGETLAVAFATKPGDELLSDWVERSYDLASFVGQTIRIAFIEQDTIGYLNVHLDAVSVWLGAPGMTSYEVYFGTNPVPGAKELLGAASTNCWPMTNLPIDSTYYWQIVAKRGAGQAAGPVWQFSVPGVGPLDHFAWGQVPSPQFVNEPFTATVLAKDVFDNTVTNFAGTANLSGRIEFPGATIGTPAAPWEFPMGTFYHDSRLQVIYLASEVGPARRLTGLALNVAAIPGQTMERWTIRMKHTTLRKYGAAGSWERTGWTTVYQSNQDIEETGWVSFEFSTPFDYNGSSSLMIDFSFNNSSYSTDGECYSFAATDPRSIGFQSDSENGDPLTWSGASPPTVPESQVPQLRLFSVTPVPVAPATTGNFAAGVWTGQITVPDVATGMSLRAEDEEEHWGRGNDFSVAAHNDLTVAIADAPDPVTIGQDLTYTITVANSGPEPATGVMVSNSLPTKVSFVSALATQGVCTNAGGMVLCDLGTIPSGADAMLTIIATAVSVGTATNTVTVTRQEPDAAEANNAATAVTTITARPAIAIADAEAQEGDTGTRPMVFHVSLSTASSQTVTVEYATADNSATAGSDYVSTNGVLTFPAGTTTRSVVVLILGDTIDETDELFTVRLSNPANATIADAAGVGKIYDDDGPGIAIGDAEVTEGDSGRVSAVFAVQLSAPSKQVITVEYYTADGTAQTPADYVETYGVLTFSPGLTNRTIAVPVRGDILIERDETFSLWLLDPVAATLARDHAVGTIINDDGLPGRLDHFGWSTLAATQYVGLPFGVMLTALDASNVLVTNFSGTANLSARVENLDMQVGRATTMWEYPMGTYYEDSRIQSIYLAGEVGPARLLTGLGLYVVSPPWQVLNRWTIRLKHTALSSYGQAPRFDRTGWTIAYQKNETVVASGWVFFQFTTPFAYDGTNNLLLDLSFNNSSWSEDGYCRYSLTPEPRSIHAQADSDAGDPLNWYTTPVAEVGRELPNIMLLSKPPVALAPTLSGTFRGGMWTGALSFQAAATNVALVAKDSVGHAGTSGGLTVLPLIDTDADQMPDFWELANGLDPGSPADAALDADGDGLTNLQEFLAGTEPRSAASALRITEVLAGPAEVRVRFMTSLGRKYRLERANQLPADTWSAVGPDVDGTGDIAEASDAPGSPGEHWFYRLKLVQ